MTVFIVILISTCCSHGANSFDVIRPWGYLARSKEAAGETEGALGNMAKSFFMIQGVHGFDFLIL